MPTRDHIPVHHYYIKISKKLNQIMQNLYNRKTTFSTLTPVTVQQCISKKSSSAAHRMLMYGLHT